MSFQNLNEGKVIIFSAPSGAGKTTIVRALLDSLSELSFSISACSRDPRGQEVNGKDYHFIGIEGFKNKIKNNEFVEWEEVYQDHFYGTLNSELIRIWNANKTVVFDVDVVGGMSLKKKFGKKALAIFVMPPSLMVLEERLRSRNTDSEQKIQQRLEKAEQEISLSSGFDVILKNDQLDNAISDAKAIVNQFLVL
ncbi:MAG: guanylate kinase [Crocinitomicaceae bacterium]|nr:guanylate kinase [Crocinitomicaceae bacterium]